MRTYLASLTLAFASTSVGSSPASGAEITDVKGAITSYIHQLRVIQEKDGSYGPASAQPLTTARVLQAYGNGPEKYLATDGPFVRTAITALLAHQSADGGFGQKDSKNRVAVTAEALLALNATARLGFEEPVARARRFLEQIPPQHIAAEDAGDLVRFALSDRIEGFPFAARLAPGTQFDAEAKWVKPFVASISTAVEGDMKQLTAAALPDAAPRLLALIDAQRAEESLKKTKTPELAPVTLRSLPKDAAEERARIDAALAWLAAAQTDGKFGLKEGGDVADPGITAIALSAVMRTCDRSKVERPKWVKTGLDWLASLQHDDDGAIYIVGLKNYVTSASVEAFAASGDPAYAKVTEKAVAFLKASQLDADEGYSSEADPYYGGFGYGSAQKPDLSNTQIALQAMHDAGVKTDDASFRKAVEFLQRCQNRTETGAPPMPTRDGKVIVPGSDGGAVYRPGDSKAGTDPLEGNKIIARSYGSMTYALLKSYLFTGLDRQDERVKAAFDWICKNYTLEVNPGFLASLSKTAPYQGLFYYYLTMARALAAFDADQITDGDGVKHDWRRELKAMLLQLQSEDGSWKNERSSRWMEEDPALVTSYALLALAEI